ncbi:MAG: nickel pincer cofactor biosynthesis protein LarC [Anaerococcus sp.]
MKILYFDCSMGAAGDMLTASLLDLFSKKQDLVNKLNEIGIEGVEFTLKEEIKSGIYGLGMSVKVHGEEEKVVDFDIKEDQMSKKSHGHHNDQDHCNCNDESHDHHHHDHDHCHCNNESHDHHHHDHSHGHGGDGHHVHRGLKEIVEIVESLNLSDKVKEDIIAVYKLIAEAESKSHNIDVSEIHFHEVGALDAIADIAAVCYLIDKLDVDKIIASPINLGSGHVRCAHGILPVPAPATLYILKDVPVYSGRIESELCTPTGAALLKYFVDEFSQMPKLNIKKIGYGMGKKDFEVLNAVRSFLAESSDLNDSVYELSCNVDDMTGEEVSFAMEKLFEAGAREVYVIPIIMKKSRPGNLIRIMCVEKDKENLIKLIFKYTTTIGIREVETKRYVLKREIEEIASSLGPVKLKRSRGYGVVREKFEYEDLKILAEENNMSIEEVRKNIKKDNK